MLILRRNKFLAAHLSSDQRGILLLEIIVLMALFRIIGLSLAFANVTSINSRGRAQLRAAAIQVAADALETYAALDPINLNDSND